MSLWQQIESAINQQRNTPFQLQRHDSVGGGCINSAYIIDGNNERYFVKLNQRRYLAMFEAEADGLRELHSATAIRVPQPLCTGVADNQSFIVMEAVPLTGRGGSARQLGEQLAQLHATTAPLFGWCRDNTIGSTEQRNRQHHDWVAFWASERLGFQLQLAKRNGHHRVLADGEKLLERFPALFSDYHPQASLLHGDLWAGNYAYDEKGQPVIFDPATYYGDCEAELAMTELFGGFDREFYSAYQAHSPIDSGYRVRKTLYNLYHILNHMNMFGGGYTGQALSMTQQLLAELR